MKHLIILLIVVFGNATAQRTVDFISKSTTLTNLNTEDYTELKETIFISISPIDSTITVTKMDSDPIVMKFKYFRETKEPAQNVYNVYYNKWSVSDIVMNSGRKGELYMTWLYPKPNDTMIIYGPLTKP